MRGSITVETSRGAGCARPPARAGVVPQPARFLALVLAGALVLTAPASRPAAAATGKDLCRLMTPEAVGRALHATIVRAEAPESDAGCEYSTKGSPSNAATSHGMSMLGAMNGGALDPQAQKALSGFSNAILGSAAQQSGDAKSARHPGEVPALVFFVHSGDVQQEMKLDRDTLGRISPVTPIPNLGDEAFESSGSTIMVRKGNKLVRFLYMQCGCATQDVVLVARQIVASL